MGDFVDVTVTNASFTATLAAGYEYIVDFPPVVYSVSYGVVDPAGGGERIVVQVDNAVGCVSIAAGGVGFTGFAIDDATHVSGVPGAHASGVVDVVVTNGVGASSTGTGLIEYFAPQDLTPTCALLPGDYAVAGVQGVNAVGTWTDTSGNGNDAVSGGGVNAPAALSGVPDFVAVDALYLSIAKSLASAGGSPPDLATLGAGTEIAFFEPDLSTGADPGIDYADSVVIVGDGASAGICYNDDGILWEAYDELDVVYYRTPVVAAAIGDKHFACGRWNGTTWDSRVNASAFQVVTATSAILSNGNVGVTTELGRSFGGTRQLDGRIHAIFTYASALSDGNVTKIRKWGQQRGIALV